MTDTNLTPDYPIPSAETEVTLPAPATAAGSQVVGGFMASPNGLSQGQVTLNATGEQILIGAAVDPISGIGVFIGNAGDGTYDFRAGDPSGHYIHWDGSAGTLTVIGDIAVSAINIPDITTANSFHVDTAGNAWWGANVASGISTALASVDKSGNAVFKSVSIGGALVQYVITNSGIFSFGDGSDGAGVADGSTALAGATLSSSVYTLTRDVYYTDLTVSTGVTINPAGYRIFGTGTLTLNGTGTIARNGNAGGVGGDATSNRYVASPNGNSGGGGGAGGAALADGYLKGSVAGGTGGGGGNGGKHLAVATAGGQGSNITATTNSIGSNGSASVAGGSGGSGYESGADGGSSLSGGTATASNVKLIANWHLATLLDISSTGSTIKFTNSGSSAGGNGGGGGGDAANWNNTQGGGGGGGGGGAGSAGAIVAIYFREIVIGASAKISANGGNGGNGGHGGNGNYGDGSYSVGGGGGGAGGSGGNGGILILVYNVLTNNGALEVNAGLGGTGGGGGTGQTGGQGTAGTPSAGNTGNAGSAGTLYEFQLSL